MRLTVTRVAPIVLFLLYAGYYYMTHLENVPITGRQQLVDLTSEEEKKLGMQSYQEILQQSKVVQSGDLISQIRKIGERIAAVANLPQADWEFNLINAPQLNAFALPGGKVAVYTGIVPVAENVNGMAVIMGHEVGHVIARHGAERLAYEKLKNLGMLAMTVSVSDMDFQTQAVVMGALGLGSHYGMMLPFSRLHESEADYIGLLLMSRACFDPKEAPKFWQRMAKAAGDGKQPAEFMSTHPSHNTRIKQLQQWIPEALQEKAKVCKRQSA
ncbi:M48 family metallopeptidase [Candidatus Albibeggiatoa sp. nov. NOAA]|uniref:M48 family metallopeptidase n=1 Tax=Candidatus Albibeggiatoa sp. nov. NOAA TaxID=3162724 RepID=UPI0032F9C992|nr:M48 family metallopeptidase [Thiotrichaceae bacterium]